MQVLNIFHVLIAIALVGFVLIQKGPGATAGAAFGSGASGTVFGARGAGNFLSRSTWVLATLFCAISLTMAVIASRTATLPESDLGVVETGVTPPAEDFSVDVPEIAAPSEQGDTGADSDLPVLDDEPDMGTPAATQGTESQADDLPALEEQSAPVVPDTTTPPEEATDPDAGDS